MLNYKDTYQVDNAMSWHVIYTKPRQEFRAEENLKNQGFSVFLPTRQVERVKRSKLENKVEPLFSRYLFIRLSNITSNWFSIRSTKGVSQLLCLGLTKKPVVVSDALVNHLKQRCAKLEPLRLPFQNNDKLEIKDGPFKGLVGFFEKIETQPSGVVRALLLIEILGKNQELKFDLTQIKNS